MGSGLAHLVVRLLPTPDIRGLNPVIGKLKFTSTVLKLYLKDKIENKRPGMAQFFQNIFAGGLVPN